MKCSKCGRTVEQAVLPSGAPVLIGVVQVNDGVRYKRYNIGEDRAPMVIRTRSSQGWSLHDCQNER